MFDIGLQEMLVIGVLALLVFGPSKLPELGRMLGRAMRELRRASDEFRSTVETNLHINEPDPIPYSPAPSPYAPDASVSTATGSASDAPLDAGAGPAEPGAVPVAVADVGEPFCGHQGARLFHTRECLWTSRIPEAERVYFKRVADARGQGLVNCPVCEPWEPEG
jgi:TatA/E family protein of Tat protein translocase